MISTMYFSHHSSHLVSSQKSFIPPHRCISLFSTHLPSPCKAEYPANNPDKKQNAIFYSTLCVPWSQAHLLPSKRTSLCQSSFSSSGLTQHGAAAAADNNRLGVREDGGDGEAAGAFDVHEERSRRGYESLYDLDVSWASVTLGPGG